MRVFAGAAYSIGNARVEVRLVYTFFLVLAAVGMATMGAMEWHIGLRPDAIVAYWAGGDRAGEMSFGKTPRELIELTHFHAFAMGAVYLILAHLVLATSASDRAKRVSIVLGFAGLSGDLAAVWLVRFVAPAFAWLELASWAAQWAAFAAFVVYPVREMWFRDATNGNGTNGR